MCFDSVVFMIYLLQEELLVEHFSGLIKFVKTRACKYLSL